MLVEKLLLSSTTVSLPFGTVQENKLPSLWSQVHGELEDAAVAYWGTGGRTGVGCGPLCTAARTHGQGLEAKLSMHAKHLLPCCAAEAYSLQHKS